MTKEQEIYINPYKKCKAEHTLKWLKALRKFLVDSEHTEVHLHCYDCYDEYYDGEFNVEYIGNVFYFMFETETGFHRKPKACLDDISENGV